MKCGFIFMIVMLTFQPYVYAIPDDGARINMSISIAEKDMQEMIQFKMPVTRYGDTLLAARQLYETQLALGRSGKTPSYSLVDEKIKELKSIKQKAFAANDELKVLGHVINQTSGIDRAPVLEMFDQAKSECESERYEECLDTIDKAYEKISELEALQTKVNTFYEATSRSAANFVRERWRELILWLILVLTSLHFTYNQVICWSIKKEIEGLERRKKVVMALTAKTQREYFEEGKVSDTTYYIRTKKYGEMMRDINRQIPVLREDLAIRKKMIL